MPIITLTTDFGTKDHFVAAVKGAILSENYDAKIVDISHEISPFNLIETGYIVKNAYKSFPKGSIHIIGVDSELNEDCKHIGLKFDGHFFICPDNGIMPYITKDAVIEELVEINIHEHVETSFPVLDVFVKVAAHIERGGKLAVIGKPLAKLTPGHDLQPIVRKESDTIIAHVIYIDNYGNAVTNLSKDLFEFVGKNRKFTIHAGYHSFNKITQRYSDVVNFDLPKEKRHFDGTKIALFNIADLLEIAIYRSNLKTVGGASTLLGLDEKSSIRITFKAE